ncbi:MAG: hypothetical protein RBS34_00450 [Desulfofustis sp.]|jgi:hypothetical protein|nr:hypothetical protein [Desulfofustis sp.]
MISIEEKIIIDRAARAALSFGTGVLTSCQEELEDYGYEWTEIHERYVFDTYIEGGGR